MQSACCDRAPLSGSKPFAMLSQAAGVTRAGTAFELKHPCSLTRAGLARVGQGLEEIDALRALHHTSPGQRVRLWRGRRPALVRALPVLFRRRNVRSQRDRVAMRKLHAIAA
eukprot:456468-Rhodomonas_salina.2